MNQAIKRTVLAGQAAIDLWLKGKDEWNKWVADNPDADVDFWGVDFSVYRKATEVKDGETKYSLLIFSDYRFPNGSVSFNNAQFGEGYVSFNNAQFGKGHVSFCDAKFGEGNVSFCDAKFGEGNVSFCDAKFGKGNLSFCDARFGEGDVSFNNAQFGKGHVSFCDAKFGEGNVSFYEAQFGGGYVSFGEAQFGEGVVVFSEAQFEGNVSFYEAQFGKGHVSFNDAKFKNGEASFKGMMCDASFNFLNIVLHDTSITFKGSVFNAEVAIGGFHSPSPIDLRHVRFSHPLDLDGLSCDFITTGANRFRFKKAKVIEDASKFRCLKKFAKETDHQQQALDFYAKEMRSSYWYTLTGLKLALFYLYDWSSDYGRSVIRPLLGLYMIWGVSSSLYWFTKTEEEASPWSALLMSLSHSIPIYSGAREARSDSLDALYGVDIPDIVHVLTISQGILSGVFLFLIALAFRNMFRS